MNQVKSLDAEMEERLRDYAGCFCSNLDDAIGLCRDAVRLAGKGPLPEGPVSRVEEAIQILRDAEAQISEYVVAFKDGQLSDVDEFVRRGMEIMGEEA